MKYTVIAKSYENSNIVVQYSGLHEKCAGEVAKILGEAFRSVEAINEETGEVELTYYVGNGWFTQNMTYGEALDEVDDVITSCKLFYEDEDEEEDEEIKDLQLHFAIDL